MFKIHDRLISFDQPAYIIAELSANHNGSLERAVRAVHEAKKAGADAIKLQTYTADTLTIPCGNEHFQIKGGTLWDGQTLYELYEQAYMPWEWYPELKKEAESAGIHIFSTAYDPKSAEFLEKMNVPVHKIASFEMVDIGLIKLLAATHKPLIISTGMANLGEIEEAVTAARGAGAESIALLKCTSAYPAPAEEMNIRSIPFLQEKFDTIVGLSDHTMGIMAAVTAVALGARIIEKHFQLMDEQESADSSFSMNPAKFRQMVDAVRTAEKTLGRVSFGQNEAEKASLRFRRSLFTVKKINSGELFTENNIRSIRPGMGLAPKHLSAILGKKALRAIESGTPLSWEYIQR